MCGPSTTNDVAHDLPIKGARHLSWGMKNRLSKLIRPDGRCFYLPIDHGYFLGPTRCLERPAETIEPLLPWADALFVTRGVLRATVPPAITVPIILRVSGGTSITGHDLADETLVASVDEILRVNASAVGVSIFVGSEYEKQTLENLADMVDLCEPYDIPVMAVTAVGKELEKRTAKYLALSCRIAAELGAKVVKTYYAAEDFDRVTDGCPVPVVMAGGPKCTTQREVLDFVHDGLHKGAIGVNLGRNVWQDPYPVAMMRSLHGLVHEDLTPDQASALYSELSQTGTAGA
ncbi:3-hydroxy-5-phosphonooxypentane-2,4-dione thiolase [Candidatus Fermentibacteria bacterium]|nr:3-hydroxy-5-phosphonooxypentane-2,4-dione thiolase [Candidatus Fermentibacteria bacterium]